MKYVIDTEKIESHGISVNTFMYLFLIYCKGGIMSYPDLSTEFNNANKVGLVFSDIRINGNYITLSKDGVDFVESILVNSEVESGTKDKDKYLILADKLRELYPSGKKPGTNLQWKDSSVIIATRLKTLIKKYGIELDEDSTIKATENYIKSFNGDFRYMQVLKYFIFKNKNNGDGIEQSSELLSYIENLADDDIDDTSWMDELK